MSDFEIKGLCPILNKNGFRFMPVDTCVAECAGNGGYICGRFDLAVTPFPPFSPSLISLMVSVDVKHHVYLPSGKALGW